MALQEQTRNYHMSDGDIVVAADLVSSNVNRDIADFTTRNVTDTTVLDGFTETFDDTPTDDELLGVEEDATKTKDGLAEQIRVAIRPIRDMAQLQYHGVGKYAGFGFKGMDKLGDNDLCRMAGRVVRVGTTLLSDLMAQGLTTAQLTALAALKDAFNKSIDAQHEAEETRALQTGDRVAAGNALWAEMVRLCSIGKSLYADTDAVKYKDYVLTDSDPLPPKTP